MYASLIGAGASQLWDLLRSQTPPSGPSASSPSPAAAPTSASSSTTTGTGRVGALSSDLNTLFLDLQSGGATSASGTADPTTTMANDLQSVFGDLSKARGAHGRHHHHAGADAQSAPSGSNTGATNPFQSLAASLLAYGKGQGLTANQSVSTSLSA